MEKSLSGTGAEGSLLEEQCTRAWVKEVFHKTGESRSRL